MPVRTVPRSYRNVTGFFPSEKSIGPDCFESPLERDCLVLLEFHPDVLEYEVQPVRIPWKDRSGKSRSYTLDIRVTYRPEAQCAWRGRTLIIEVKTAEELAKKWKELVPKFRAAWRHCQEHGWIFKIVTDRAIRTHAFKNAKFLLPFRRHEPHPEVEKFLLKRLAKLGESTPEDLVHEDPDTRLPALWNLLSLYRVGFDLDEPLSMNSFVWSLE